MAAWPPSCNSGRVATQHPQAHRNTALGPQPASSLLLITLAMALHKRQGVAQCTGLVQCMGSVQRVAQPPREAQAAAQAA